MLIVGVPFFLVFMGSVRLLAHVEGRIVEALLGVRMPRRLPVTTYETGLWARIVAALSDLRTWSSLAYLFLMLPLGITYFVAAVTGLAVSGGLVVGGLWNIVDRGQHIQMDGGPAWLFAAVHSPIGGLMVSVIGVVLFFATLHLARAIGWLHGRIAEHLLVRL